MCGILGIYNIDEKIAFDESSFLNSLLSMRHRGPDAHSIQQFEKYAILGHLRLSIIDLTEESNQPFQIGERYYMVFNGEIFNYIELKQELEREGCLFRTSSDTEVLLQAYITWGENCVKKFNGMWAFAIYDKIENVLFCSRDRFGIKPFNYALVNNQFIFSSEIKGIITYYPTLKKANYNVIANYCRKSIGAQIEETWFEDVLRLPPAHNLKVDNQGIKISRYWDYRRDVDENISFQDAKKEYLRLFEDAIRLRMRSDVPIGFTLSSGIDSSSLVSILKGQFEGNKNTYTAAFTNTSFQSAEKQNFREDVEIDEPNLVRKLTNELDLTPSIIEVDYGKYVNDLYKIITHLESGHGSPAVFPLYKILCEATKDVTVILEGQGADELLGGYISSIHPFYVLELLTKFKFGKAINELREFTKVYSAKIAFMLFIRVADISLVNRFFYFITGIENFYIGKLKKYKDIKDVPLRAKGFKSILNKNLYRSHIGGLVNLLHYGDAISMSNSLESRLPFMDYRLIDFVFSLPSDYKIRNGIGKYLHRQSMQGIVPDYIINNPIKFGFESPLAHLFSLDSENTPKSILLSDRCLNRGLFSKKALEKAFDEQKNRKVNHSRFLYRMLSVELWFRAFID